MRKTLCLNGVAHHVSTTYNNTVIGGVDAYLPCRTYIINVFNRSSFNNDRVTCLTCLVYTNFKNYRRP
jgi:hypothetical protein